MKEYTVILTEREITALWLISHKVAGRLPLMGDICQHYRKIATTSVVRKRDVNWKAFCDGKIVFKRGYL